MQLTQSQRATFNRMCDGGGSNVSVLRAVAAYVTFLEEEVARLIGKNNDLFRSGASVVGARYEPEADHEGTPGRGPARP